MASLYSKVTSGMTPTTKGIFNIVLLGGAGVAAYLIYRSAKKKQDEAKASQAAAIAAGEISQLNQQGIVQSYSDSEFANFVHTLVQAMNGCGTDEQSVYSVFQKLRNDVDIRKLITAFGVQYYEPCAASQPLSYLRWQWDSEAYGGDLSTWLGYDLTTDEIEHINSILLSNGINYQF